MSYSHPCHGQVIVVPSSSPSASGPPRCLQVLSIAKNFPPALNSAICFPPASTSLPLPSGTSATFATLMKLAIRDCLRSGRVLRVDSNVIVAQVASQNRRRRFSHSQIEPHRKFPRPHRSARIAERLGQQPALRGDLHTANPQYQLVGLEIRARRSSCHQNSADIRIASEERCLDQRRVCDLTRRTLCV